ncbi:hypothetical protein ACQ4PT_051258 [Festuca glaucescens]
MAACRRQLLLPLCLATLFCYGVRSLRELSIQCGTQKYEIPSTYATNVDRLLSKLREEAIAGDNFFHAESVSLGAFDADGVTGRAVCYTDHSRQECAECLMEAVPRFGDERPNSRNASIFYEACLLFYFHLFPLSQFPYGPYGSVVTDRLGLDLSGNEAAAVSFQKEWDLLLRDLRDRAISSGQYAATNSIESAAGSIYGLVQCVLSLTEEMCRSCLNFLILSVQDDRSIQNKTIDFASEAAILMAFKHKNLVKLLGYCDRGEDRLLCFEYLGGGSLDKLIYSMNQVQL